ncbi:Small heat shock protein C4 [Galdieria sulphuraria]|nr:Small heat shock protein C4 [Galdieria sulphuraria]
MSELVRPGRFFDSSFGDLFSWATDPFYRDIWSVTPRSIGEGQIWSPRVDLVEKDDCFLVKAEVPGVPKENINVDLKGDILTVSGWNVLMASLKGLFAFRNISTGRVSKQIAKMIEIANE